MPVELRLVDGSSRCQGCLEIRPNSTVVYGQACDNDVGSNEATVICRQLNCGIEGASAVPVCQQTIKITVTTMAYYNLHMYHSLYT